MIYNFHKKHYSFYEINVLFCTFVELTRNLGPHEY